MACGGVALYVRSALPSLPVEIPSSFSSAQIVGAKITTSIGFLHVFSLYVPPNERLDLGLLEFIAGFPNAILCGDMNARHVGFGDSSSNTNGRILKDFLSTAPLVRAKNTSPTYIGGRGSITDHVLYSDDVAGSFEKSAAIGSCVSSDHVPLVVTAHVPRRNSVTTTTRATLDFRRTDWDRFRVQIERNSPDFRSLLTPPTPDSIDAAVDTLVRLISDSLHANTPTRLIHINPNRPPLPPFIIKLIKEKRVLYRHYRRTRDPLLKTQWNRLNAVIRLKIKLFKERAWRAACAELDANNGPAFWKLLSKFSNKPIQTPRALIVNGVALVSDRERAEAFARFLEDIHKFKLSNKFDNKFLEVVNRAIVRFSNTTRVGTFEPVLESSVAEIFARGCRKKSAPGPDGITWSTLAQLPDGIMTTITLIFNACLSTAHIPARWKSATVVMIPKAGKNTSQISAFRPISLLDTLGKCLEKIVLGRLSSHCDAHNIISPHQYGFRKGYSAADAVIRLHAELVKSFNGGQCSLAAFLDLQRAFDCVWHRGLLFKLITLSFPSYITHFILDYLTDRRARVRAGSELSSEFPLEVGLPQGAPLAPALFSIFSADTPTGLAKLNMYADDTVLWVHALTAYTAGARLQKDLDAFEGWSRKWRISVNPLKTRVVLFRPKLTARQKRFTEREAAVRLGGRYIHPSPFADYLGVRIDANLSWNREVEHVISNTRKRSALIFKLMHGLQGCSPRTLLFTYKAFVRPLIEYHWPSLICSHSALDRIASTERRMLRIIFRLPYNTSSNTVYGASGMEKANIVSRLAMLGRRYINKRTESRPEFIQSMVPLSAIGRTRLPRRFVPYHDIITNVRSLEDELLSVIPPFEPEEVQNPDGNS